MMVRKSGYEQIGQGEIGRRVCIAIATTFFWVGVLPIGRGDALPWMRTQQAEADRPPNTAGQSAGSRGCALSESPLANPGLVQELGPLRILSPEAGAGNTALAHPTFAWFTSVNTEEPVELRVYRYTNKQGDVELFYETELTESLPSSGIKFFSLPSIVPLALDDRYILQIEIVCNPAHPSGNLFSEIEINRTEIDQSIQLELEESVSINDTLAILNREGLWLDALDIAMQSTTSEERALEQLALATQNADLYELSRHFSVYSYPTTP